MKTDSTDTADPFDWQTQPAAAAFVRQWVDHLSARSAAAADLRQRLLAETGTRLFDWVDHLVLRHADVDEEQLAQLGFAPRTGNEADVWDHPAGLFPAIRIAAGANDRAALAVKVESVADYCVAQELPASIAIEGEPWSALRRARVAPRSTTVRSMPDAVELWVVERRGTRGFDLVNLADGEPTRLMHHREQFVRRERMFDDLADGFAQAAELIRRANDELGVDRTCDLFFAAEREYWQSRNRAAQVQRARQEALGVGWANHDHHTYRSSRQYFADLVAVLEQLGFVCRERFYAGAGAGWGAQVLEQPNAGVVIFADVDLSADEVTGDFAHDGLAPRDTLGTVGLWCELHGESFLQAGMHHLECQFDFDAVRSQLAAEGVESMAPFTDFPHLKQAFTEGEIWPVAPERIAAARAAGFITDAQAAEFSARGALGSHLEMLERNDGYKGFNQTGISEIIRKTDPRRQSRS